MRDILEISGCVMCAPGPRAAPRRHIITLSVAPVIALFFIEGILYVS